MRKCLYHFAAVTILAGAALTRAQTPARRPLESAPAAHLAGAAPDSILPLAAADSPNDPVAGPKAVVTLSNARFTVLTPQMIRMEWAADGKFEDHASLVFINRRLPARASKNPSRRQEQTHHQDNVANLDLHTQSRSGWPLHRR